MNVLGSDKEDVMKDGVELDLTEASIRSGFRIHGN
jgi:hypothetical protein